MSQSMHRRGGNTARSVKGYFGFQSLGTPSCQPFFALREKHKQTRPQQCSVAVTAYTHMSPK